MKRRRKIDEGIHELRELEVQEVSLVDRPANGRRFSMVKNEEGLMNKNEEKGAEITEGGETEVTPEETPEPETFADVFKSLDAVSSTEVAKRLAVAEELKGAAFKACRDAMRRIHVAMDTLSMSETDEEDSESAFKNLIGAELMEVGTALSKVGRKFGGKVSKSEPEPSENSEELTEFQKAMTTLEGTIQEVVEKKGAKMARGRLTRFEDAVKTLTEILSKLKGKDEANAKAKLAEMAKSLDDLKKKVGKQAAIIKSLKSSPGRPATAAIESLDVRPTAEDETRVSWDNDEAEAYTKATAIAKSDRTEKPKF